MAFSQKIQEKLQKAKKPIKTVYPIIIILAIPVLLVINTVWNLKSFNRDANFLVRHQAVSVADSITPIIKDNLTDTEKLKTILTNVVESNSDILTATIIRETSGNFEVLYSTETDTDLFRESQFGLNQLAIGFDQPFAGLTYDPTLQKKVWNVVVPLSSQDQSTYLLNLKLSTDQVNEILNRTTRDSLVILVILIVVTIVLIANHFIFYLKALKTEQLEEIDRLKDEFVSIAAHDLRAPITGLVGYLQLLQSKLSQEELVKVKSDLDTLNILIQDLDNLITDLLEVSRIEQGRFKVVPQEVHLNEVIKKVIKTLEVTAQKKDLRIVFQPTVLPSIKSDPDRIRQVLTNIISNSIKYTLKGQITVTSVVKGKFIETQVKDTGIGIPAKHLPQLFSKFHRVKDKQTIKIRGTGLGLWITKQIVEFLGGKIYAESIYGTGTVITFTLPFSTP